MRARAVLSAYPLLASHASHPGTAHAASLVDVVLLPSGPGPAEVTPPLDVLAAAADVRAKRRERLGPLPGSLVGPLVGAGVGAGVLVVSGGPASPMAPQRQALALGAAGALAFEVAWMGAGALVGQSGARVQVIVGPTGVGVTLTSAF